MKSRVVKIVRGSFFLLLCMQAMPSWHEVDFDTAMQVVSYPQSLERTIKIIGVDGVQLLAHFRALYARFNSARKSPHEELKIPKIIHHIWLGSPLPPAFERYVNSWKEKHGADWKYYFWTDREIEELKLDNQKFYDATDNYGVKSDIARLEILYRFGGVYVDTDFECLAPLDDLHYICDFYTGLQPLDTYFLQLGSALIGSVPGHPILKDCIETIAHDWHLKGAPAKTGPIHCTKSFIRTAGHNGRIDVALPATYFYPLNSTDRSGNVQYEVWQSLGSLAVHHWSKSWMPAAYRPLIFRTIDNDTSTMHWNK